MDPFSGQPVREGRRAVSYLYKVWNNNPKAPSPEPTPGVIMVESELVSGAWVKRKEVTPSVRAVVLFGTPSRILKTNNGAAACLSKDGLRPLESLARKGCEAATSDDLVKIMSTWKGFDKTKVDSTVSKLLNDEGRLSFCALDGKVPLCPQARRDPFSGKVNCRSTYTLFGYDLERERQFKMELTGPSQYDNAKRYVAPIFDFMREVFKQKKKCYELAVDISPLKKDDLYVVNFSNWSPVDAGSVSLYEEKAKAAYARYTDSDKKEQESKVDDEEDVFG